MDKIITIRLNELQQEQIKQIIEKRKNIEGTEYTTSDIIRIAISYAASYELWESIDFHVNINKQNEQLEYAKNFWNNLKNKDPE